uniref:Ycf54-like protein n=1 Tax=Leersia perrieri TaxID=77586 RepID=A0A0D9VTM4_9ORYZ
MMRKTVCSHGAIYTPRVKDKARLSARRRPRPQNPLGTDTTSSHPPRRRRPAAEEEEAMVAPATLSLRPCATLAPPRPALPRSSAGFALRRPTRPVRATAILRPPSRRLLPRAVAVDSDQQGSPKPSDQEVKAKKYYFLVANAKFMLDEEEHFQEQLKEKLRNYGEREKEQDFWLVVEPKFLERFPDITKRLKRPAVALVSTDGNWITFMKLRLDRVLAGQFEAETAEEALASDPAELKFEKPEKWTAPYPKYEYGWWEPFLPPKSSNGTA